MNSVEPVLTDQRVMAVLGSLATAVSCEMSDPLAFMLSNLAYACEELGRLSQVLRERFGGHVQELEEIREALSESQQGAHRLKALVDDVRKLSSQVRAHHVRQQLPTVDARPAPRGAQGPAAPPARGIRRARQPDSWVRSVWRGKGLGQSVPRWAGLPATNGDDVLPGQDRAILEAFRRGEPAVLTQVYRTYSPEVVRYLSRRFQVRGEGGTRPVSLTPLDLESAHQETFVRAFRPPMRLAYDGVRPCLGFLLTIANSTAIDLMRASGKVSRQAIALDDAPDMRGLSGEAPNPEEQALEAEVRTLVRRFLDGLPEQARELARLRFMEGLSQDVAAERLGLTRGEVRVRERHLRVQFTKYLESSGWLESLPGPRQRELAVLLAFSVLGGMGGLR